MVGRGNKAENIVIAELVRLDHLPASRRHLPGPGDVLAVALWFRPLLIEVKATLEIPWRSKFGPADRKAMLDAAAEWNVEALLAWVPPYLGGIIWLPPSDWP